jgi:hypothetical protein
MTDNTATARLYAPWRDDPRPAAGLLQGIYAFFGIAEFWRRQRSAAGNPLTDFEYAYARAQTQEALETALSDGALTGHGRRFAEQLAGEVLGWSGDPIDEDAREQVRLVVEGHRAGWRIRHCRPDPADVAAIVRALKSGASAKVTIALSQVQPDPAMRHWSAGRLGLARRRLVAPEQLTEVRDEEWGAALTDADLALVTGEPTKAAAGFTDQIGRDPESADAWTGLGLALSAGGGKSHILVDRPEVVLAVHRELHTRHDPAHLAARVAACLPTEPE